MTAKRWLFTYSNLSVRGSPLSLCHIRTTSHLSHGINTSGFCAVLKPKKFDWLIFHHQRQLSLKKKAVCCLSCSAKKLNFSYVIYYKHKPNLRFKFVKTVQFEIKFFCGDNKYKERGDLYLMCQLQLSSNHPKHHKSLLSVWACFTCSEWLVTSVLGSNFF